MNLDRIPIGDIARWVKLKQVKPVENFIGNRILYPQTVSTTQQELEVDFAIMRESLKINYGIFLNSVSNKLVLNSSFISRFPPLNRFIKVLAESIQLSETTTVFVRNRVGVVPAGTIINIRKMPNYDKLLSKGFDVQVDGKIVKADLGKINILPLKEHHIRIKIGGVEKIVTGGEIGLILDFRTT